MKHSFMKLESNRLVKCECAVACFATTIDFQNAVKRSHSLSLYTCSVFTSSHNRNFSRVRPFWLWLFLLKIEWWCWRKSYAWSAAVLLNPGQVLSFVWLVHCRHAAFRIVVSQNFVLLLSTGGFIERKDRLTQTAQQQTEKVTQNKNSKELVSCLRRRITSRLWKNKIPKPKD